MIADKLTKGYFYFVPIYYNEKTSELGGRGPVSNIMLDLMIEVHHLFLFITSHFIDIELCYPLKLEKEDKS